MKHKLLFIIACFFAPLLMKAQKTVEITPFGGYVFAARMSGSGGYVRFADNAQYGGSISIGVSRVMDVDIIYNRTDTKAQMNFYNYPYEEVPLSINYMNLGFTKNFRINPTVSPYVGFNMGACLMAPKSGQYYDYWFFDVGLNGGAKIYFGKHFGLKLQAQAFVPIQAAGLSFMVGTGGTGGGLTVSSTMVQFGFTGGLIFKLGHAPAANNTKITY
ncbi:MAG: hypothetical protein NTY96_10735 [Bacteroidetes bacterium]|nr:hypothetical protein [Bacteroidota bacterium]